MQITKKNVSGTRKNFSSYKYKVNTKQIRIENRMINLVTV